MCSSDGLASCKELYVFHFLFLWSQPLKASFNYPIIMDDKAGLREVKGLAEVTQPLSGNADTQVLVLLDAKTWHVEPHCATSVKTVKPTVFPEYLKLSSKSKSSQHPHVKPHLGTPLPGSLLGFPCLALAP